VQSVDVSSQDRGSDKHLWGPVRGPDALDYTVEVLDPRGIKPGVSTLRRWRVTLGDRRWRVRVYNSAVNWPVGSEMVVDHAAAVARAEALIVDIAEGRWKPQRRARWPWRFVSDR
jgi:hypothetical protein